MQNKSSEIVAGTVYFDLTLTGNFSFRDTKDGKRMYVEATCICGVVKGYPLRYLKTGNTKSCGCQKMQKLRKENYTHRMSAHPLYTVYQGMKNRCCDPKSVSYHNYGGRGIKICDEWLNDVKVFCDWGMANGYEDGLYIDRIDNDGMYCPENCRFVTKAISNTNTRRIINVTAFGETKCIAEWTRDKRCSVSQHTLKSRVTNGKWDIEDAITNPIHGKSKELARKSSYAVKLQAWGEEKSIIGWSEDSRCKVGYSGLKIRLKKGWDVEKAISTENLNPILKNKQQLFP